MRCGIGDASCVALRDAQGLLGRIRFGRVGAVWQELLIVAGEISVTDIANLSRERGPGVMPALSQAA